MTEFDIALGGPVRNASHGSAYIEDGDDTRTISSFSTNATMDDNPGAGLTIDKYFYQPVGRAIERLALYIGTRLNVFQPSPAQILRFLALRLKRDLSVSFVEKPSYVIARISAERPSAVPGILSLFQQSQ